MLTETRTEEPAAPDPPHAARRTPAVVWAGRALLPIPFVLMAPEILAYVRGEPDAAAHIATSTADVLGISSFLLFSLMLAVTPVQVVTGRRDHVVLRRDLGLGMFAVAVLDLVLAALTTGEDFGGGFFDRVGGHSFLFVGTLATLLVVPLALTANHHAQRLLGRNWKRLHRLTYAVWALILLHLLFLFGLRDTFLHALEMSVALVVLRLPPVRRWWVAARRAGTHELVRAAGAGLLLGLFVLGAAPFVVDLVHNGAGAFSQHPVAD